MSKKKLNKELIATTNQDGLSEAMLIQDCDDKINVHIQDATIAPDLDPTPQAMQIKMTGIKTKVTNRNYHQQQAKQLTGEITVDLDDMKSLFARKWATYLESIPGMTVETLKLCKFGSKGIYNAHPGTNVSVTESEPVIIELDDSRHLEIMITIINSKTKSVALPPDAKNMQIWYAAGDVFPTDLSAAHFLGNAPHGKFTAHFPIEMVGQNVCFAAIYEPKVAGASVVISASIKGKVS